MKIVKFFKKIILPNWLPDEYFTLKELFGKNFEIDAYTVSSNIRTIRIKLFDNYWNEEVTSSFKMIGKIEEKERIKKIFQRILKDNKFNYEKSH